ncbi:hypothetical protein JZ751_027632 [Albula glossodonta]|uniref:Cadherin domain-containing protein n=1 Tax=Albula glossodonta TaxID=121402 RepID=A0A8T2PAD8_9TELE|nr:hypothetical protein JZ751_027632 [Albula glossodonta]
MISAGLNVWVVFILFFTLPFVVYSKTKCYVVEEEKDTGTEIGHLGRDLAITLTEDPNTSFRFIDQPNIYLINLRESDGRLTVAQRLDREQLCHRLPRCLILLDVVAVHNGSFHLIHVEIEVRDINDNAPAFPLNDTYMEIPENEGINGEVVYGFVEHVPAEIKRIYKIDPHSGHLTLERSVDYENSKYHELKIQAYDLGLNSVPAVCTVTVEILDVNDNAPDIQITPFEFDGIAHISEAAAEGSFVALIRTSDRDSDRNGHVRCILQGHEHFKLQPAYDNAFLILTTAALDRETIPEYNLTVVARDSGSPELRTTRQCTVRLTDENDNPPVFSKSVYEVAIEENNVVGAFLTSVLAYDPDLGQNADITYTLVDENAYDQRTSTFVTVDPVSGSVYSSRSFDYELTKEIEARVLVSDAGFPSLSQTTLVRIKVIDKNDNAPRIVHPTLTNGTFFSALPAVASVDIPVLQIIARDDDEGRNAELTYQLLNDRQNIFNLNRQTGNLFLRVVKRRGFYNTTINSKQESWRNPTSEVTKLTDCQVRSKQHESIHPGNHVFIIEPPLPSSSLPWGEEHPKIHVPSSTSLCADGSLSGTRGSKINTLDCSMDGDAEGTTGNTACRNGPFVSKYPWERGSTRPARSESVFDNPSAFYQTEKTQQRPHPQPNELPADADTEHHTPPTRRKSLFRISIPKTKGLMHVIPRAHGPADGTLQMCAAGRLGNTTMAS